MKDSPINTTGYISIADSSVPVGQFINPQHVLSDEVLAGKYDILLKEWASKLDPNGQKVNSDVETFPTDSGDARQEQDVEWSIEKPLDPVGTEQTDHNKLSIDVPQVDWRSKGPQKLEAVADSTETLETEGVYSSTEEQCKPVELATVAPINVINATEVKEWCSEQALRLSDRPEVQKFIIDAYYKYCIGPSSKYAFHIPTRKAANKYGYVLGLPDWLENIYRIKGWPDNIYYVSLGTEAVTEVQRIINYLMHLVSEGRTKNFDSFNVVDAIAQSIEYDEKSKMVQYDEAHEPQNVKELVRVGNSTRWVELINQAALSRESEKLNHCVGRKIIIDYAKEIAEGHKRIFSLRAQGNKPLYTVDLTNDESNIWSIRAAHSTANSAPMPNTRHYILGLVKYLIDHGITFGQNTYFIEKFLSPSDMKEFRKLTGLELNKGLI